MSPPIPAYDPMPPRHDVEHHFTLDEYGRPVHVADVIYLPPNNINQMHEMDPCDQQMDFLEELIQNTEVKNVLISLNKTRRKLFRENGLLKKRMEKLELQHQEIQHEMEYIYQELKIKKKKRIQ